MMAVCALLTSCYREPHIQSPTPVDIYSQTAFVVTPMTDSSIISIPTGMNEEYVINSETELYQLVPSKIIAERPELQDIDFITSSLLVIKFRLFYNLERIESSLYKREAVEYIVRQILYVGNEIHLDGYFVMYCLITAKIPTLSKIVTETSCIWQ